MSRGRFSSPCFLISIRSQRSLIIKWLKKIPEHTIIFLKCTENKRTRVIDMKALICSSCGASRWKEDGEYRFCLYCGTKYEKVMKGKISLAPSSNQSDAARQVVSGIALNDDVERLLQKCRNEPLNAKKYANLVLDIDPTNKEAQKYLYERIGKRK